MTLGWNAPLAECLSCQATKPNQEWPIMATSCHPSSRTYRSFIKLIQVMNDICSTFKHEEGEENRTGQ